MKKIIFLFVCLFTTNLQAQDQRSYESVTYLTDISVTEIPRFVALHKKFTDLSLGPNRTITGDWLFRHWYGSGHTFVIYQQYATMEDYHADADAAGENVKNAIAAMNNKKKRETAQKEWAEYRSFSDGHTDEIRATFSSTGFATIENVNFDIPFVMSVGRYNSSGSWAKMGNAYFDWAIKPAIDSAAAIAGGVSYHYMGSGPEVEVWQCFNNLVDFAKAATTPSKDASKAESRKLFWGLVKGAHEDQIYMHIGHVDLEKRIFDLAGADK